jgi:hypothetical protein
VLHGVVHNRLQQTNKQGTETEAKRRRSEGQLCPSATLARMGPMPWCLEYQ